MIKWETKRETFTTMFGGKGYTNYSVECDKTDTSESVRKELEEKYSFEETYPGEAFIDSYSVEEGKVRFTVRCYGCD